MEVLVDLNVPESWKKRSSKNSVLVWISVAIGILLAGTKTDAPAWISLIATVLLILWIRHGMRRNSRYYIIKIAQKSGSVTISWMDGDNRKDFTAEASRLRVKKSMGFSEWRTPILKLRGPGFKIRQMEGGDWDEALMDKVVKWVRETKSRNTHEALNWPLVWKRSIGDEHVYLAKHKGQKLILRMKDFPDEPLYNFFDGERSVDLDDLPENWEMEEDSD